MGIRFNGAKPLLLLFLFCINSRISSSLVSKVTSSAECAPNDLRSPLFAEKPINISASLADSHSPALAVSSNVVHVAWEENERLYHRFYREGVWSPVQSVATGEQPSIAADANGMAHLVFVNEFGGNYEIYYCRWNGTSWSLPRNVSNTSGVSSSPRLAIAPDGTLHVVWADNTPGYSVIYHAYWSGVYWLNEPILNATGGAPAVSVSADAAVHVVWQDRDVPGAPYEIYYSRWDGKGWSLPENLSDSTAEQSIIPAIVTDEQHEANVVWQEKVSGKYTIYYTRGRVSFWSMPEKISTSGAEAHLPCITVSCGYNVCVGWDESTLALYRCKGLAENEWSPLTIVSNNPGGVADLQLASDRSGQLHAVWAGRISGDNWDVFYQKLFFKLALPIVFRNAAR